MQIEFVELEFDTGEEEIDIIDITSHIQNAVKDRGNGFVNIFVQGSTGGVTAMEYEDGLKYDLRRMFGEIIPREMDYRHNSTWGDENGHSHLRASLLKPSLTVPFRDGKLLLGIWQQIVVLDFDNKKRKRKVIVQIVEERVEK